MQRSSSGSERVRARAPGGFTLLEVLAAVLVLGLLYTVLADVAIHGLRAEGESRRRLEASLYADELLADIEGAIAAGDIPLIGVEEEEDEPYVIELAVSPVAASTILPAGAFDDEETGSLLIGAEGEDGPIREIAIRVSWSEGDRELSVVRTTFGVSPTELGEALGRGGVAGLDGGSGSESSAKPLTGVQKMRRQWERSGRLAAHLENREKTRKWHEERK